MMRGLFFGLCLLVVGACRPPAETEEPIEEELAPEEEGHPLEPAEPANKAAGEELDVSIPGVEGDAFALADWRGKTVVVALASTWQQEWPGILDALREIRDGYGDRVELVIVAGDREAEALDDVAVDLRLGWDPQGAVAARLNVARFPTLFILAPDGRIAHVLSGWGAQSADALRVGVEAVVAGE